MTEARPKLTLKNQKLIQQVNDLINPLGCSVTGIGPKAIGVLGDARSVGISVVIRCGENVNMVDISTLIINRIKGITRVLMDL